MNNLNLYFFTTIILLTASFNITLAQSKSLTIANFVKLRGDVALKRSEKLITAGKNINILEKDTAITKEKSFASIKTIGNTIINLSPNSSFNFEKFKNNDGQRHVIFNLLKGKIRTLINKKTKPKESISYKINSVAIGVRGTEFLANAYQSAGKKSTDFLLVKGNVKVDASKLNGAVKSFNLKAGQSFNSQDFLKNGLKAIKNVPLDILEKIKGNPNYTLPNMQLPNGSFMALSALFAATALLPSSTNDKSTNKEHKKTDDTLLKQNILDNKKVTKRKLKIIKKNRDYEYILKNEPIDIRNALINYKENIRENKCYFWIYKKIAGGFKKLRFKRKRDCNDFENDL